MTLTIVMFSLSAEMSIQMSNLTLDKFECDGESGSVVTRWERWKRSLYIYLEAANIVTPSQKRASLLHFGGPELQEIFYNIPGAHVTSDDSSLDVFTVAVEKLDEYFAPKQSKRFERHIFRQIKQGADEKFDKFLVRLRLQATKCQFTDKEDHLIDQITEKCASEDLRKKILRAGDKITLDDIIHEANSIEAISRQLEGFIGKEKTMQVINKIEIRDKVKGSQKRKECYRCGSWSHLAYDDKCPAKGKECLKCGKMGHFKAYCKTNPLKRKQQSNQNEQKIGGKRFKKTDREVKNITEDKNEDSDDAINYVFNMNDDTKVTCRIGGTNVDMLIDSGCQHNLITDKTWEEMKKHKVIVSNQVANPNKTFVAYGSKVPLKLRGSFESDIQIADRKVNTTFYVVKEGSRDLLGKVSAIALGVLRIGLEVNQVEQPFSKFKDVLIQIPIDKKVKPVVQPYRRIPIPLEEKVDKKIHELLEKDIIEKVQGPSSWISPIVPILKDNGDIRLCVDMRRANTAILRENHPLPTMDCLLPKMGNAKVFSKLDIKDAFHQLELHPDSRYITTFISSKGLYRYKRLMFGITCAPEVFQKTLANMLVECEGVFNFIDDILVYGETREEHDDRLQKVMEVLETNRVVLRKEKCIFNADHVQFLGHQLSQQGIRPLEKYLATIKDFRAPKTVSELQSFMGLVNYVGKWIPNLATTTEPLKELLRQKSARNADICDLWGPRQQTAFNMLKTALGDIPNLGYYNVKDKTLVFADASPVGLGAVLVQINEKGPRIIAYGNKTLSACERRYCQTEKEALALVWAVEHFHMFLYGKEFELITDHKPLEIIFGPKSKPCARIERWILRLQSYKYKVVYRPGKNNIADPLSRLSRFTEHSSGRDYVHKIIEITKPIAVTLNEIEEHCKLDTEIQKVKEGIYNNNWDETVKTYKLFANELCFCGEILLRGTKIVIPKELRNRVLAAAHEGHPGIVAMKLRLRTKVWWPKYDKEAEQMVRACRGCTLVSAPNPPNPLKRREMPTNPWIDIAIDLLGPLPSGDHLLVVIDYYSRYKEIKFCREITSKEMVKLLKEIFSRLGCPVTITSDNGKQFVSEEFESFCRVNGIKLLHSIPYWPQQNGEVERQNRDILKRLRISQAEGNKHWKESLLEYLTMYNSTPHTVTGKPPAELFFRRKFRDKIPMIEDVNNKAEDMDVRDRDKQQKEKGKEYADKKRKAQDCDLGPGDKVYVRNMNKSNKLSSNFEPTSHTVKTRVGGDIEVQNDETGQRLRRNIVHLKRIEGQWKIVDEDNENSTENEANEDITEDQNG